MGKGNFQYMLENSGNIIDKVWYEIIAAEIFAAKNTLAHHEGESDWLSQHVD